MVPPGNFSVKQPYADKDQRNTQPLSHIDGPFIGKCRLVDFCKLEQKPSTEKKDQEQAKNGAFRGTSTVLSIKGPENENNSHAKKCFIQHRGMPRQHLCGSAEARSIFKYDRPGQIGGLPDDFRVDKVRSEERRVGEW